MKTAIITKPSCVQNHFINVVGEYSSLTMMSQAQYQLALLLYEFVRDRKQHALLPLCTRTVSTYVYMFATAIVFSMWAARSQRAPRKRASLFGLLVGGGGLLDAFAFQNNDLHALVDRLRIDNDRDVHGRLVCLAILRMHGNINVDVLVCRVRL